MTTVGIGEKATIASSRITEAWTARMRWTYIAITINQFLLHFVVRICSFLSLYSSSSTLSLMIVSLGSPPNRKGHAPAKME